MARMRSSSRSRYSETTSAPSLVALTPTRSRSIQSSTMTEPFPSMPIPRGDSRSRRTQPSHHVASAQAIPVMPSESHTRGRSLTRQPNILNEGARFTAGSGASIQVNQYIFMGDTAIAAGQGQHRAPSSSRRAPSSSRAFPMDLYATASRYDSRPSRARSGSRGRFTLQDPFRTLEGRSSSATRSTASHGSSTLLGTDYPSRGRSRSRSRTAGGSYGDWRDPRYACAPSNSHTPSVIRGSGLSTLPELAGSMDDSRGRSRSCSRPSRDPSYALGSSYGRTPSATRSAGHSDPHRHCQSRQPPLTRPSSRSRVGSGYDYGGRGSVFSSTGTSSYMTASNQPPTTYPRSRRAPEGRSPYGRYNGYY